jgi:hypothetical protein
MGLGGELRVLVKGGHLAVAALVGSLRKGLRLYPTDPSDPLAFEAVHDDQAMSVVFKRGPDGRVASLQFGMNTLHKRSGSRSLRVRLLAGAAAATGLGLSLLAVRLLRARRSG